MSTLAFVAGLLAAVIFAVWLGLPAWFGSVVWVGTWAAYRYGGGRAEGVRR